MLRYYDQYDVMISSYPTRRTNPLFAVARVCAALTLATKVLLH